MWKQTQLSGSYQEAGGQHGGKEKESLIVKIKLRQQFANGPFPSGFVFKVFCFCFFFSSMYFFLFCFLKKPENIYINKSFQRAS